MSPVAHTPHLTVPVTKRDHTLGPHDAPVVLVEYGDFECPHCARAHGVVKALRSHLGDGLRFVYRHFPLATIHPHATLAAEAAEAAAAQGEFWQMHDTLFEHQDALELAELLAYAREIGLEVDAFEADLVGRRHAAHVQEDFRSGVGSGVNGTPTFFINGARHNGGYDFSSLLMALERAALGP